MAIARPIIANLELHEKDVSKEVPHCFQCTLVVMAVAVVASFLFGMAIGQGWFSPKAAQDHPAKMCICHLVPNARIPILKQQATEKASLMTMMTSLMIFPGQLQ
jgi:hypothetical protein